MVEILPSKDIDLLPATKDLLYSDEIIVIVDDSPEVKLLLEHYLSRLQIPVVTAHHAEDFFTIFQENKVALVFLDIGLPGKNGIEILTELVPENPDLGIIMVTGTTDVETALECIRKGADDYLTKPVTADDFFHTLQKTLKKRRMAIENRLFQHELEVTNFRMEFLHNLNFKMNTAYLNALELDSVLQTILVGITSAEGLQFNRAFLALFDENGDTLVGKFAVGPSSKEEAGQLWHTIREKKLDLHALLDTVAEDGITPDSHVNRIVRELRVKASETDHILMQCSRLRKSMNIRHGRAQGVSIPESFLKMLNVENFVVVPLFSPSRSLGVIIADNFVTDAPITDADITALEIFANQASLAIEHSHLYRDMNDKIAELEQVTEELENNKDMLIEAERYSTIGFISAQLVHAIRNPLTTIGGTARLLLKKTADADIRKFLRIMTEETTRIEETLNNIFHFSDDIVLEPEPTHIAALLQESLALFYTELRKSNISVDLDLQESQIVLNIDAKKTRTVFNQLLRMVITALSSGGKITVSFFQKETGTTVRISAEGRTPSKPAFHQPENPAHTIKTYGTSLELSAVERILELHKAKLTFQQPSPDSLDIAVHFPGQSF